MKLTLSQLRFHTINTSLFPPTSLAEAIAKMHFIQADPIRSPARAQDLILRHRVKDYHINDLENNYPLLGIDEDFLYAYGFVTRDVWNLLHPRKKAKLNPLEKKVLDAIPKDGKIHPKELETVFGKERVINAWGRYSKQTTQILEDLHYYGFLRIAGREKGIRLYENISANTEIVPVKTRLRQLILITISILGPISFKSLQSSLFRLRRHFGETGALIKDLIKTGELETYEIEGVTYILTLQKIYQKEVPAVVRFLAPFDPLIWDRARFEHFWGWQYRFEAYTPIKKRIRGYYAMPILWKNDIIGWANVKNLKGIFEVQIGYVKEKPTDKHYDDYLQEEIERLKLFLINR